MTTPSKTMLCNQSTAVSAAGRPYATLVAHVHTRGSADLLQTCELLKLAESCEAPPNDAGAWRWVQDFAKPLLREMAVRLSAADQRNIGNERELVAAATELREAERVFSGEKTMAHRRAVALAQRRIDELLTRRNQMQLFSADPD